MEEKTPGVRTVLWYSVFIGVAPCLRILFFKKTGFKQRGRKSAVRLVVGCYHRVFIEQASRDGHLNVSPCSLSCSRYQTPSQTLRRSASSRVCQNRAPPRSHGVARSSASMSGILKPRASGMGHTRARQAFRSSGKNQSIVVGLLRKSTCDTERFQNWLQ